MRTCSIGGELPFIGKGDDEVAEAVKNGKYAFDEDLFPSTSENAKDFIEQLICKFPK